MPQTVLLIGTRKGLFMLESDGDRRELEGPGPASAKGGRSTTRCTTRDSGAIYAAAASEWHGAGVWRSSDLGETWELSSEGLAYAEGGQKVSKISGLTAAHGRLLAGVEAPGIFESRDGGETWSLLSTLEGQPGSELWNDPANQPPGHLGHPRDPARIPTTRRVSGRSCRASASSRRPTTPRRGRRATGGSAPTGRLRIPRSGTACTSS